MPKNYFQNLLVCYGVGAGTHFISFYINFEVRYQKFANSVYQ